MMRTPQPRTRATVVATALLTASVLHSTAQAQSYQSQKDLGYAMSAGDCISQGTVAYAGDSTSRAAYCLSVVSGVFLGAVQVGRYFLGDREMMRKNYSITKTIYDALCANRTMASLSESMQTAERIVKENGNDRAYGAMKSVIAEKELEVQDKSWKKDLLPELVRLKVNDSKSFYALQGFAKVMTTAALNKDMTNNDMVDQLITEAPNTLCASKMQALFLDNGKKSMIAPLTRNAIAVDVLGNLNSSIGKYSTYADAAIKAKVDGQSYLQNVTDNIRSDVKNDMQNASNAGRIKANDLAERMIDLLSGAKNNALGGLPARDQIGNFDKKVSDIIKESKFFNKGTAIRDYGDQLGIMLEQFRADYRAFLAGSKGTPQPQPAPPPRNNKPILVAPTTHIELVPDIDTLDDDSETVTITVKKTKGIKAVSGSLRIEPKVGSDILPIEIAEHPVTLEKGKDTTFSIDIPVNDVDMTDDIVYRLTLTSEEAIVTLPTTTFVVKDAPRSMLDRLRRMKAQSE